MEISKVPLLIYTHSDCEFIYPALIGQVNKHVKEMDIYFAYNENAEEIKIKSIPDEWKKITYDDSLIWTSRVDSILKSIPSEYVLFIHEDWLPTEDVKGEVLNKVIDFMDSIKCDFMMSYSHIAFTSKHPGIFTGYEDYYYYPMPTHVFQPAIWKKITLEEFCKLGKSKIDNEDGQSLNFMRGKNCWSVQNIKTVTKLRSTNSLIFPHMHALSIGLWNFLKYPTLKELLDEYGIDTNSKGICNHWEIDTQ